MTCLTEEFQSRREYREQLERAKQEAGQHEDEAVSPQENITGDEETTSRHDSLAEDQAQEQEAKTQLLKRKLNIAIVVLLILISIVYIILFFVG